MLVLTMLALTAAALGRYGSSTAEAMALLAVPTTFAATIVLTRAEAPLEARLSVGFRRILAALVFLLWVVAVAQVLAPSEDANGTAWEMDAGNGKPQTLQSEKED